MQVVCYKWHSVKARTGGYKECPSTFHGRSDITVRGLPLPAWKKEDVAWKIIYDI